MKILSVDDSAATRLFIKQAVFVLGCTFNEAENGRAAFELLETQAQNNELPDLIERAWGSRAAVISDVGELTQPGRAVLSYSLASSITLGMDTGLPIMAAWATLGLTVTGTKFRFSAVSSR